MQNIYACLLSVVWFTVPTLASANTWPGFGATWSDHDRVTQHWFEHDSVTQTVADTRLGRDDHFSMDERARSSRETKESGATAETDRERSHESERSDNTARSSSNVLDRSYDTVHSPSHHPDPWWGRRVEGDPMIRELSRKPSAK